MDRRQRKTRAAIFDAFTLLLEKRPYHHITVQEIIDKADIGRATFYAHFETKDYLLKDLCDELFGHISSTATGIARGQYRYVCENADESIFLHLLRHLQGNDYNILALLSSPNQEMFMPYFKSSLQKLIDLYLTEQNMGISCKLPHDYLVNHVATSFVETVNWWLRRGRREAPEVVAEYFEIAVGGIVK